MAVKEVSRPVAGLPRVVPSRPAGRRQVSTGVAAGVVCVLLGAVGAAWFAGRGDPPTAVVVLARDLGRGETITAADVSKVELNVDNPVNAVVWADLDAVVGRHTLVDLASGTVLSANLFADTAALPAGMAVVGVVLPAGGYPSPGTAAGDIVQVVATANGKAPAVLVDRAEVYRIGDPEEVSDRRRFVSLLVPANVAPGVSAAAAAEELRLVGVS